MMIICQLLPCFFIDISTFCCWVSKKLRQASFKVHDLAILYEYFFTFYYIPGVLKKAGSLMPAMMLQEVETAKHKHRSKKYCEELTEYLGKLSTSTSWWLFPDNLFLLFVFVPCIIHLKYKRARSCQKLVPYMCKKVSTYISLTWVYTHCYFLHVQGPFHLRILFIVCQNDILLATHEKGTFGHLFELSFQIRLRSPRRLIQKWHFLFLISLL